jgi:hypothetical protein
MSDLPAGALDYRAVVAEYFLGLRGSGLMLSPIDQEVVADWERRGIPVPVVCRGLRRGAEELSAHRTGGPRSIRTLRGAVEDEWHAYRGARVGDAPPPPAEATVAEDRLARARDLVESAAAAEPDLLRREGYRAAWRALAAASASTVRGEPVEPRERARTPLERVEAALVRADERILSAWLAGLPPTERRALGARIRRLAGPRRRGESRRAHREALRAHLLDLGREAGLTCLRGSV